MVCKKTKQINKNFKNTEKKLYDLKEGLLLRTMGTVKCQAHFVDPLGPWSLWASMGRSSKWQRFGPHSALKVTLEPGSDGTCL